MDLDPSGVRVHVCIPSICNKPSHRLGFIILSLLFYTIQ